MISGHQSNYRSENAANIHKCKRTIEERVAINEVALSTDKQSQRLRASEVLKLHRCFDECQTNGYTKVHDCNTLCTNGLIQGLWKRINLAEYDQITSKYA